MRENGEGAASRAGAARVRAGSILGSAVVLTALVIAGTAASAGSGKTLGKSTVTQRIVPSAGAGFRTLGLGPGEGHVVREDGLGVAQPGRAARRRSLVYFGQLSDFQLADEESPARVEFADFGPASAAWRPWEALNPQIDNEMVRQLNAFARSPIPAGNGSRARMDFTIDTGDSADSQQLNETRWVRTLLEGGTLDPNSGINAPASYTGLGCGAGVTPSEGASPRYTGVQDPNDYLASPAPQFYYPDDPSGAFADWPRYPGLLDRAQRSFRAVGLGVRSYVTFGNHDALVQGNAAANAGYEQVAIGCLKPMSPLVTDPDTFAAGLAALTPQNVLDLLATEPEKVAHVPPDPGRQFASKAQYKQVFLSGSQPDGHGFAFIDPVEQQASHGAAGYYSWHPKPGIRFVSLDTVSEGGVIGPSADGNVDEPQFHWLTAELDAADAANELVVIFSHHAPASLTADVPDEVAPPCTAPDEHGHDVNPGCDVDPRSSQPIHLESDLVGLLHEHPSVIAWMAGHSHVNDVSAYPRPGGGGGFWSIRVAAEADWPQQSRVLEIFDNADGTLSLFGTILDHAAPATAPPGGTNAASFDAQTLASVGRTLSYNDPQSGARACTPACGEGEASDRNVELLIDDPRN